MRRRWIGLTLFLVSLPVVAADPVRWRQDLQTLATELPRRHVNWFAAANRQQFEAAVADLDRTIPDLSDSDVIVGLARIVALGHDGHTAILLFQPLGPFRQVGLRLTWFPDGIYVTEAAPEWSRALGARVVRIGDTDTERAYQAVAAVISQDNPYWLQFQGPIYLTIPEVLRALRLVPEGPAVRYTLEDSRGNRFTVDAAPAALGVAAPNAAEGFTPVYQRRGNQNYWFEYLEGVRTLYFKYNQAVETPGRPFTDFARELLAALDAYPVERLVVDVRNNTGGDSAQIDPLAAGVAERLSRLRAFVLTGPQTASSAMDLAAQAQGAPKTLVVGEPTGGKPSHFGDVRSFNLPNSGLEVRYSTKVFTFPGQDRDAVYPDLLVTTTAADYFSRHDPVLQAVLAWQPPSGEPIGGVIVGGLAVVNAASFRPGPLVAPGTLVSAFGAFEGVAVADATAVPLPRQLGGVEVRVNAVAAPLLAVRATQLNFQIPPDTALGQATVDVVRGGQRIAGGTVLVVPSSPGLFSLDPQSLSRPGAVLNQDNSINGRSTRARRGEVVQIFGTGLGVGESRPVVYLGTEPAEVLFSGISAQFPGLWQINARVPDPAVLTGEVPVFVTLGGASSNAVTVWVGQ